MAAESSLALLPLPKKPKTSLDASDSDKDDDFSGASASPEAPLPSKPKWRFKRRKAAIFLAYCGAGYQGMQKNPGARTIEGDLEEALFLSGAVSLTDRGIPRRYDWARAARTDKGVSAAGQVVSGRFYVDPPGFVDRLNSHLHPQIRVLGFKRATASFNAKKFCDRRRYVYLLPVFALDPNAHPDRESVIASLGTEKELSKCLECSERGRKAVGLMGGRESPATIDESEKGISEKILDEGSQQMEHKREDEEKEAEAGTFNPVEGLSAELCGAPPTKQDQISRFSPSETEDRAHKPDNDDIFTGAKSELHCEAKFVLEDNREKIAIDTTNGQGISSLISEFHYGEEEKKQFNSILMQFVGTHNFHNFTTRTKAEDPSSRRYIISFEAESVVNIQGVEFIKCEVVGQSFMLHQIRKMIGLAVAIMRKCAPVSLMDVALKKEVNINVPTAPEVGLFLDECLFTSYNKKWIDTHEELSMEAYAEQAEEFKMKNIYPHIASMEVEEGAVALWLHSLNRRNYPDFSYLESNQENASAEHTSEVVIE